MLKGIKEAKARLKTAKEQLELLNKVCEDDVQSQMKNLHEKNVLIRSRLSSVFGKFERVLADQGRTAVNHKPQ